MRVLILYHEHGEHTGLVADYVAEFQRYKAKQIELVSLESIAGADLATLYGVTQYPAILAMSNDGSLQRLWQGMPLPLMDELSYYSQPPEPVISHHARTLIPLAA